jgi:CRISPR system Cascade subunit CasA
MPEKEFNLLLEPWILVMKPDGEIEEVSILDAFKRAEEFRCLAGELPAQDIAVMRLLLAILHVVFSRFNVNGTPEKFNSPFDALDRWEALWKMGAFPMKVIENYLRNYEDRFYLFHPERPFYQVPDLQIGSDYPAAKLIGELSESNHKLRLFPQRSGKSKNKLQYSEAARWLLYLNAFDDTSAKPKEKNLPSPGVGWLGKLGLVIAMGNNLFETLLLNLIFLKDGTDELWGQEKPIWEAQAVKLNERTEIIPPNNLSELYTLQSRRLLLKRMDKAVIGYTLLGGDFFPKENAFAEQMTTWKYSKDEKDTVEKYRPRRHDPSRQLWRDYSALIIQTEGKRRPGIVSWLARIASEGLILGIQFRLMTVAVHYADKDFFVDDLFADDLFMNASLLTNLGEDWVNRIVNELETTELLVRHLGFLAENLAKAAGYTDSERYKESVKEQAFFQLDAPFRRWLEAIDPEKDETRKEEKCEQWWEEAKHIVRKLGRDLVEQVGPQAFVGRVLTKKVKGKEEKHLFAAPDVYNEFLLRTASKQSLRGVENHGK